MGIKSIQLVGPTDISQMESVSIEPTLVSAEDGSPSVPAVRVVIVAFGKDEATGIVDKRRVVKILPVDDPLISQCVAAACAIWVSDTGY